jgi:maleate cis-trans isomerase
MHKAIHAQASREAAQDRTEDELTKLTATKLKAAAELVDDKIHETLIFYVCSSQHWIKLETNDTKGRMLEVGEPACD